MKLSTVKSGLIVVMMVALFALPQPVHANAEGEEVVIQDQITIFAHTDAAQNLTDGADLEELLARSADAAKGFLSYAEEVMEAPFSEKTTVYLFPDAETRLQGLMDVTGLSEERARNRLGMHGDSPGGNALAMAPGRSHLGHPELFNTVWVRLDNQGVHVSKPQYTYNVRQWLVHELTHLWVHQHRDYNPREEDARSPSRFFSEGIAEKSGYRTLLREGMTTRETFCHRGCRNILSHFYPNNFPEIKDWDSSERWNQLTREYGGGQYLVMGLYFTYLHETYNTRGANDYYQFINQGHEPTQAFEITFGVEPSLQDPEFHEFIPEFLDL